jgi:putative endonuclease
MTYTTYVLYSKTHNKIYIGYSQDVKQRLSSHNSSENRGHTKKYQPWEIIYTEEFEDRSPAMKREKELKTSRGRQFIWEYIKENILT